MNYIKFTHQIGELAKLIEILESPSSQEVYLNYLGWTSSSYHLSKGKIWSYKDKVKDLFTDEAWNHDITQIQLKKSLHTIIQEIIETITLKVPNIDSDIDLNTLLADLFYWVGTIQGTNGEEGYYESIGYTKGIASEIEKTLENDTICGFKVCIDKKVDQNCMIVTDSTGYRNIIVDFSNNSKE